jgi:hypothetical protein
LATTFVFQSYYGAGPTWTTLDSTYELVGFYGATWGSKVAITEYQTSTHISGAGGHVCSSVHPPNTKYISSNQFDKGGGTLTLNTSNLGENECPIKIRLGTDAGTVTQNGRFYCYNGTTTTTLATNIQVWGFERFVGVTGGWVDINNGSTIGGDNVDELLVLQPKSSNTVHEWFIAVSCKPLTVGAKTAFSFGCTVEYY